MAKEEGTHNTAISDSDRLDSIANMIGDACNKFDSLSSRMDAFEAADKARKDSEDELADKARKDAEEKAEADKARKDAVGEIEATGEAKDPAADKARKDAEEKAEADKARKDAEEKEAEADKARKDSEAEKAAAGAKGSEEEMDSLRATVAGMADTIASLQTRVPALLTDNDREKFARIQEAAEPAFQAFGDRAPAPMQGETTALYQRRLASKMQKHSGKWSSAKLSGINDDAVLDSVTTEIYSDAIVAARRGTEVAAGQLRAIEKQVGGHTHISYEGSPDAWMNGFAGNRQVATGKFLTA